MKFREVIERLKKEDRLLYEYSLDLHLLSNLEHVQVLKTEEYNLVYEIVLMIHENYKSQHLRGDNVALTVNAIGKMANRRMLNPNWNKMEHLMQTIMGLMMILKEWDLHDKEARNTSAALVGFAHLVREGYIKQLSGDSLIVIMNLAEQLLSPLYLTKRTDDFEHKGELPRAITNALWSTGTIAVGSKIKSFKGYPTKVVILLMLQLQKMKLSVSDVMRAFVGIRRLEESDHIVTLQTNAVNAIDVLLRKVIGTHRYQEKYFERGASNIIFCVGHFVRAGFLTKSHVVTIQNTIKLLKELVDSGLKVSDEGIFMILEGFTYIVEIIYSDETKDTIGCLIMKILGKFEYESGLIPIGHHISTRSMPDLRQNEGVDFRKMDRVQYKKKHLASISFGIGTLMNAGVIKDFNSPRISSIMMALPFMFNKAVNYDKMYLGKYIAKLLAGLGYFSNNVFSKREWTSAESEFIVGLFARLQSLRLNEQHIALALLAMAHLYFLSPLKSLTAAMVNALIQNFMACHNEKTTLSVLRRLRQAVTFFQSKLFHDHGRIIKNLSSIDTRLELNKPPTSCKIIVKRLRPNDNELKTEGYVKGWHGDMVEYNNTGKIIRILEMDGPKHKHGFKDNFRDYILERGFGITVFRYDIEPSTTEDVIKSINSSFQTNDWPESRGKRLFREKLLIFSKFSGKKVIQKTVAKELLKNFGSFESNYMRKKRRSKPERGMEGETKRGMNYRRNITLNPPKLNKILAAYPYRFNFIKSPIGEAKFKMLLEEYIEFLFYNKEIPGCNIKSEIHKLLNLLTSYTYRGYTERLQNCVGKKNKPEIILKNDFVKHVRLIMKKNGNSGLLKN